MIAQDIIHLLLVLQEIVNHDPDVSPYMTVLMVENYNVSYAEKLIPACDISEQISLASKEASGTGNMKFMLNGAVTLGTSDGANVEIHELVGDDNIYIFGEKSETVIQHYEKADYVSKDYYKKSPVIKEAVDFIVSKQALKGPALTVLDLLLEQALNNRNQIFARRLSLAMQQGDEDEVSHLRELFGRFDEAVLKFMPDYRLVDTSALKFIHRDKPEEIIRYYKLSTGEKQLLYLLLTVCNTLEESTILLLDEADTGMHVDWKKILLKELLNINPDMQVIAATHSPSLINGWYDNTREISQLYVKTEKGEGEKLNDVPEISE